VILVSIAKRKNPSNNSGGLGSWREQQRTIESPQKYASCLTRPPQVSEGFLKGFVRQLPHRRADYKHTFFGFATPLENNFIFYVATLPPVGLSKYFYFHFVSCWWPVPISGLS
jgi:hypothetical protein